ncbi:NADPH-dependent FMN reductase [Frateuria soli]|uniref:NADPH-dependent FMN reductase n=1 Tax=Frateuria soli TaxID=1542730 RepID=UPI001E37133F|nr:NADPH-dependent FMN reductase [Frateuria soli]UGB37354.1 NAD(P)H-dependent oxidoreductase [Frateuria soli]
MTHRPPHILGLAGSLRRASWNRHLLHAAATSVPADTTMDLYETLAEVPLFDEDQELATPGGPPGVRRLREAIAAADGLLIATPEYNHALPGVLKNALDWLSREGQVLDDLPVAVLGASSGPWGTRLAQASLRQVLHTCGALVMPSPTLFVAHAEQRFDARGRLCDPALQASLSRFMESFAGWIDRVTPDDRLPDVA